jgi:hypothetical protein
MYCFEWYKGKLLLILGSFIIFQIVSYVFGLNYVDSLKEIVGYLSFFTLAEIVYFYINKSKINKSFNEWYYRDYCYNYIDKIYNDINKEKP